MNYLQLCQEIVNELGLSGRPTLTNTNPMTTSTGSSPGEIVNVGRWIRDAALSIDNMWEDWKYLWNKYSTLAAFPNGVAAGQQTLPAPPNGILVRQWNPQFFRWRPNGTPGAVWSELEWYTREEMLQQWDPDNSQPGPPVAVTIQPDNTLYFASAFDIPYDFLGEFWQRPVPLAALTDTPLMPAEYHRGIVCRASVMYANREDAPEVIAGMEAELIDVIDKLQADQLERFGLRRSSTDRERRSRGDHIARFLQ